MNVLERQVRTRGGVFGPGGYGGGIFDGSSMGFGQYEQGAAGVRGLGQDSVEDWVAEQSNVYGPAYTSPTAQLPPEMTGPGAPSSTPTTTSAIATYPWNTFSTATRSLQKQANVSLRALTQPEISEDGYLGPETCGALEYLQDAGVSIVRPSTCQSSAYSPSAASAETAPVAVPYTGPADTVEEEEMVVSAPSRGISKAGMAAGLGILAVIGFAAAAAARKKKGA